MIKYLDKTLEELLQMMPKSGVSTLSKYETHCKKHGKYVEANHLGNCFRCLDEERAAWKEQEKQSKRLRCLREAGLGKLYHNACFTNVHQQQESVSTALQSYKFDKNIMLIGTTGVGKTYLAAALINSVIDNKVCNFVKFYKLTHIKIREQERFEDLLDCDFLVIDEFGVAGSDYKDTVLYEIYDYRSENCLPTMMISNLTADMLKSQLSDALYSRIKTNCLSLVMSGQDLRLKCAS